MSILSDIFGPPAPPTKSTNKVTDLSTTLMDIDNSLKNAIQSSCTNNNNQSNVINVINSKIRNVTAAQKNVAKNLCSLKAVFSDTVDNDLQGKIASGIVQTAESTGTNGLLTGAAVSENIVTSIKKTDINVDNGRDLKAVKDCINRINQSNIVNFINSDIAGSDFKQLNNSFSKCLQSLGIDTAIESNIKTDTSLDVDQEAESKGGDMFASLASFGMSGGSVFMIILIILFTSCSSISSSSLGLTGAGSGS